MTRLGDAFSESVKLVEPERFTATSADGSEVEAWFMPLLDAEPGMLEAVVLRGRIS